MNYYLRGTIVLFFSLFILGVQAQLKKDTSQARVVSLKADSLVGIDKLEEAVVPYSTASDTYKKYAIWNLYYTNQAKLTEVFSRQGLYDKAIQNAGQNLEEVTTKKLTSKLSEAKLLNQLGFAYLNKGRNDLALENCQKAASIISSEKNIDKATLASVYNNLGLVYWNGANTELALEHLQKSLTLRKELYGANHVEVADGYNNLGLIYSGSDSEKALTYYTNAQKIYEKIYQPNHSKLTNTLTNIAIIQRKQKMYTEALQNFQKVLNSWGQDKIRHPKEGFVYSNVGEIYLDMGEIEKAIELKTKALELLKAVYGEKHPEIASVYNQLGEIYLEQNKVKKGLEFFQAALVANSISFTSMDYSNNPGLVDYYNSSVLLQSLQSKARSLEQLYATKSVKTTHLKIALDTYYLCDTLIEKSRKIQTNKNDKIALGKKAATIYEDAIRICLLLKEATTTKRKYTEAAFYFSEKSKTAVLLEAISDAEAKHFANIPDAMLEEEKNIKSEIAFLEQKLAEKKDTINEKLYREKLFSYNRKYEKFISDMEKQFPEYYNLKYNVKSTSVKSIQKRLPKGTALVSYFIADDSKRVYVFYLTNKKYILYDVPENDRLNKLIIGYRNAIKVDAQEVYLQTASALYRQLIPFTIKKSLQKLVIIPDGKVGTIPFEAFITKKTKPSNLSYTTYPYLIKKCEVTYGYSVNLYEQSLIKESRSEGEMFLCAPVDFSGYTKNSLSNLPATSEEVSTIQKMFTDNGIRCAAYTGKQVQESMIKSKGLETYNYLHFATHGIVDEVNPELSEIYLAPDTTKKEDGNLYSGEIYNLKINADLVTLSACQTGLGKIQKGEGIIGLSRALLYAGAKNLVVSLWSVADKSTSLLMVDFYNNLLKDNKSTNYSTYMRLSKLAMIEQGKYCQPYYWAPFILVGK